MFDSELNESLAIRVISKIGADKEDLAKEKTINE